MTIDLARFDARFRYFLLSAGAILGTLDFWLAGHNAWVKSAFVITVAGLVGYFTNFLAIKMLFQPKRGSVLGWRGLVPKNKAQIARSLGESVQEQLLSPDVILSYVRERNLIEQATQSAAQWIDNRLQNPELRHAVTRRLIEWLHVRGPALVASGFDVSEQGLLRAARKPELIADYWDRLRSGLMDYLAAPDNRQAAAASVQTLLQQRLPEIASWLDEALEDYLRKKHRVGSVGLGLKSLIALDRDAIEALLARFVEDPQVGEQLMLGLDAIIDRLGAELAAESTQALVQERLGDWIQRLASAARENLLPLSIEELDAYLSDEQNWSTIEEFLVAMLTWTKERAMNYVASAEGQQALRNGLERLVKKSNVTELVEEQVLGLDTDDLEALVLDNTGGNLTVIQVLGGVLGMIAGTVQVHIAFTLPILLMLGVVWIAWRFNEWQQSRIREG